MPLMPNTLIDELSKFIDEESGSFQDFPSDKSDAADKWAKAFDAYAKNVIPASSGMNQAAISAFKGKFMTIEDDNNTMAQLAQCFVLYAARLALGMTTALSTMVGTPPAGPLDLSSIPAIGTEGGKSTQCIQALAIAVDTWMRTGKAVNNLPAGAVPIPVWS